MQLNKLFLRKILVFSLSMGLFSLSVVEFWNITWGTGEWLGQFSLKWGLAFFLFVLFGIFSLVIIAFLLMHPEKVAFLYARISSLRDGLGLFTWVPSCALLIVPIWLLQFTDWGLIITKPFLRILIWVLSSIAIGSFITRRKGIFLTWSGFLASLTLTTGSFVFAASLSGVTDYPFSLGWSEGNRLWDYSIFFGRHLYDYPIDKPIPVLLDIGRQFVGGIPFLIPGILIWQERLWISLTNTVPYLILGWIAFRRPPEKTIASVILAGIWAFIFLKQGPIHPPLLLCAVIVAVVWRQSLWIAIPSIILASYFAHESRFTWLFAPAMWAGMLELSGATLENSRLIRNSWVRAISVGLAGLVGGYLIPSFGPAVMGWIGSLLKAQSGGPVSLSGITPTGVAAAVSEQSLLWYRLFPNATYGYGILMGLLLATLPLIMILIYLVITRRWMLNVWQKLAIVLPLLAFLVVGLIVSVKIGGGGDLHNMDMFLIGLMFAGAIAWRNVGYQWIGQTGTSPVWVQIVLFLAIVLPGYQSLMGLKPVSISGDLQWVMTLADIPPTGPLPELLPAESDIQKALNDIRYEVEMASSRGDVLFIDQRQLLTFGYVEGITLVPEYDKKVLINQAMSEDARYFEGFYRELASHRFSLIISNPLHERVQTDADEFGEENNAWVKWVSTPLLCYYEPLYTLRKVKVQLLVPRQDISNCSQILPK
jgi:hypothetical protein